MALTTVKAAGIAADSIDETKIADNGIDSEHYNDGSIDHEHLANDAVDGDIIADNAVGLAHMAGGTDGVIITYDASGDPVHVGPGNDGQVLTSTGAGSPPAFEDLPASGVTVSNNANNRVVTGDGTNLNAEAGLTCDGTHLSITDGNLVVATAGHGIDFSATANADQNSPTMSNELLDDYEEGSWTPQLKGISLTGTGTYPTLWGSYTKIGRVVFVSFGLYQSAHTGSGNLRIDGLPFTAHLSNGTYTNSDGSHNITGINGESITASKHQIIGHLENYQTRFRVYQVGSDGSTVAPSWVNIENGDVWMSGNFYYETNS